MIQSFEKVKPGGDEGLYNGICVQGRYNLVSKYSSKKYFEFSYEDSTPAPVCGANGSNGFTFKDAKEEILKNLKSNIHNTFVSQKKVCNNNCFFSERHIVLMSYTIFIVTGQAGCEDEYYSI